MEATVTEKPKRTRKPKPEVEATPAIKTITSIVYCIHQDGSRTGLVLQGIDPAKWLQTQKDAKPNFQKWQPSPISGSFVAPNEALIWMSERTRTMGWAKNTYYSIVSVEDAAAGRFAAVNAADNGRIYLVGTVEV